MTTAGTKPPDPHGRGGARPNSGRPPKGEQQDAYTRIAKAKAKEGAYRAQMAELEYRRRTGELVPVDEVAASWVRQVGIAKGRLLAMPLRISAQLARETDPRAIEQLPEDALLDVLEELANGGHSTDHSARD